jgi:hypothetical protein
MNTDWNAEKILMLVVSAVGFVAGVAAIVSYMRLAPWWETWIGRLYVALLIVETAALGMVVVSVSFNGFLTRTAWATILLAFAVLNVGHWITIIHTQRDANKPQEPDHHG